MGISPEVLAKLVCDNCKEYLSIGPVMLLDKERSVCGRCSAPDPKDQSVLRNLPYELLATDLLFPCQNKRYGCTFEQKFNNLKTHEAACDFRQYACFLLENRSCEWFGAKNDILVHCKTKHPDLVVQNPTVNKHEIVQQSVKNFLMSAFNMLFLIHTKVCLQTKQIYHCVRLLGDAEDAKDYSYTLEICQDVNKVTKMGEVKPQGCLSIKESDSIAVGINNLIGFFNGYAGTTFKLTVNCLLSKQVVAPQNELQLKRTLETDHTRKITFDKIQKTYSVEHIYDDKSKLNLRYNCNFKEQGCKFTRTIMHYLYHCSYRKKCVMCGSIIDGPFLMHCITAHFGSSHSIGEAFTEQIRQNTHKLLFINNNFVSINYSYIYTASNFALYCTIDSIDLQNYALELCLKNPQSGYILRTDIPSNKDDITEGTIEIKEEEFIKCVSNNKCIMTISVSKI